MEEEDANIACMHVVQDWYNVFKKATDFDLWGQPVEAIKNYNRLIQDLHDEIHLDNDLFNDDQKKTLAKTSCCLVKRVRSLQAAEKHEIISLQDLKKTEFCLKHITTVSSKDFPLDISTQSSSSSNGRGLLSKAEESRSYNSLASDEEYIDKRILGTLLPPLDAQHSLTLVTIRIERIDLKEPSQYLDCYITATVTGDHGTELTPSQDTPVASQKQHNSAVFGVDVHLQKTLELLPPDFAVFFEFKHYKPKKKMISTKCWAFMERDEIKEGRAVLEIYKKPVDYKRKRVKLLTEKPFYLHVKIIFNT